MYVCVFATWNKIVKYFTDDKFVWLYHSASNADIQGLGRWAYDAFRMSYLTNLPYAALLVAAGFRTSPKSYILPRSRVPPPLALTACILPWVAPELEKIKAWNRTANKLTSDTSAEGFLSALVWLKIVFLQDMALLQQLHPALPIFTHQVFSLPEWSPFAEKVQSVDTAAANEVSVIFDNINTKYIEYLCTILTAYSSKKPISRFGHIYCFCP